MLRKIGIIFGILLLTVALLLGVWYETKTNGWPMWVGVSIVAGVIGVILFVVWLRRHLLRSNEKAFVKRVIAQEGDAIFATQDESSLLINDLESQWQKSISTLYSSKLNNRQNSIYALPWFLVIGESGAGKTSMLKNSRLSSPVTDVEASAQYSGTKNCDWWFFEDAIILDTAGRYSVPVEEKKDNAEWERFLSLLSKYRKKEPLNGLVITISVERLLENDKDIIQADALSIRKRVNQLMITIGAKFPVYLMVTKMDQIYGFTDFCESLPEALQTQAMGFLNETSNQHWDEVIDEALFVVKKQVSELQLRSVEKQAQKSKEILLFTKEFDQIAPALKDFSQIVFGDNPYQKIPLLRGVYFSSALSDGSSSSAFLSTYDLPQTTSVPQNRAYFITDFFKTILPSDRNIYTPIKEYLKWQQRNYKIALGAWSFIFASCVGIYSYSYIQNVTIISDVKEVKTNLPDFEKMDLTSRILALDELRLNILKIEELSENMMLPFLKFKQSCQAEDELKELYLKIFYDIVYRKYRYNIQTSIENITHKTLSKDVVSYIGFLIDSISISKQTQQHVKDIKLSQHYFSWLKNVLRVDAPKMDMSVALLFMNEYIAYQVWSDSAHHQELIKDFQMLITSTIDRKGESLHWLTDEGVSQTQLLRINDFFEGVNLTVPEGFPMVSGSLIEEGRQNLLSNIKVLVDEIPQNKRFQNNLSLFWVWYDERFYYRWKNFMVALTRAEQLLKPHNQEQLLYSMTSDKNPYFKLIHRMAKEFKAYKSIEKTPEWSKLVIELDTIMSMAENMRNSKNSLLSKMADEKNTLLAKVDQETYVRQIKSATILSKYLDELSKLSVVVDSGESVVVISNFFSNTKPSEKASASLSALQEQYKKFIHSLPSYSNSKFVYKLLRAPESYIINYCMDQLDESLNEEWENSVLGAIPLSGNKNLLMSLFDKKQGLVWKYVDGPLKPFLQRNRFGYHVKKVSGYHLHIKPLFLRYINSGINLVGAYEPKYDIMIQTLPFNVNSKADVKPDYINLHLQCVQSDYLLKNENYRLSKVFSWVPGKCGDLVLTFGFKDFKITKSYQGENGFLYFLKDFRSGTKVFNRKDFDIKVPELQQYNIKYVKVSYNISHEGQILKLLDQTPYNVPQKVVSSK